MKLLISLIKKYLCFISLSYDIFICNFVSDLRHKFHTFYFLYLKILYMILIFIIMKINSLVRFSSWLINVMSIRFSFFFVQGDYKSLFLY